MSEIASGRADAQPLTHTAIGAESFDTAFGLWLAARGVAALVHRAASTEGWSTDEYAVASMIAARGALTTAEIAQWMAAPVTTASSLLRRMEARGDLERRPNARDARSTLVALTPAGDRRRAAIAAAFEPARAAIDDDAAAHGWCAADFAAMRVRLDAWAADELRHRD